MDGRKETSIEALLSRRPPYSMEAEQAVLGCIILDGETFPSTVGILHSDDFYVEQHKAIYLAAKELFDKNKRIDAITVLNILVEDGVYTEQTGAAYIRQLAECVPSISNILDYAKIVHDKALLRRLIAITEEIAKSAYNQEDEVQRVIDSAEQMVFSLAKGTVAEEFSHIKDVLEAYYGHLTELINNKEGSKGIPTYFKLLDNYILGLKPGTLFLVGARPGMGKTSFIMNIGVEIAKRTKKAVAVFSLEMSKGQLVERMIASEALVDSRRLQNGQFEGDDLSKIAMASTALAQTDIYIDDTTSITVTNMRAKLRRIKNLGVVLVDYLQLMKSDRRVDNRVLEIGEISRGLKILSKDLNVPVIVCTQLNREAEKGGEKTKRRPQLSDLRDSGAIEQDADVVVLLYRDEYYDENSDAKNQVEVIVAQNRYGATGKVILGWDACHTRFMNIETKFEEQ